MQGLYFFHSLRTSGPYKLPFLPFLLQTGLKPLKLPDAFALDIAPTPSAYLSNHAVLHGIGPSLAGSELVVVELAQYPKLGWILAAYLTGAGSGPWQNKSICLYPSCYHAMMVFKLQN